MTVRHRPFALDLISSDDESKANALEDNHTPNVRRTPSLGIFESRRSVQGDAGASWNRHGVGGGDISAVGMRYRDHFAVLNRADFEELVLALETGALRSRAAAAELRAADQRVGAKRSWMMDRHFLNGFPRRELREMFSWLKGFLAYTFGKVNAEIRVADTEERRAMVRELEQQQAAIKLQCLVRSWFARRLAKKQATEQTNSRQWGSFFMRSKFPPKIGNDITVGMNLYHAATAHVELVCTQQSGDESRHTYDYSIRHSTGGVVEFYLHNTPATAPQFVCSLTGVQGQRQLRLGQGFPIIGDCWSELPPLIEIPAENENEKVETDVVHIAGQENEPSLCSSGESCPPFDAYDSIPKPELLSGWLRVFERSGLFSWRWCVLTSVKLEVFTCEKMQEKRSQIRLGPRLVLTQLKKSRAREADLPIGVRPEDHPCGFIVEPEGLRAGTKLIFDASEPAFFRSWVKAVEAAVAGLTAS